MMKEKTINIETKIEASKRRDNYLKNGGVTYEDSKKMNPLELRQFIMKDNIWIKPDYAEMLDEGYEPEAIYFLKKVRDALPCEPICSEHKYIKDYFDLLEIYKKLSRQIRKFSDIQYAPRTLRKIAKEMNFDSLKSRSYKKAYDVANIKKTELIELANETQLLNFPYEFDIRLEGLSIKELGPENFVILRYGKTLSKFKCEHTTKESAMKVIHDEIIPWLKDITSIKPSNRKNTHTRPPLEEAKRVGPDYRCGSNITEKMILNRLNLRSVEFINCNTESDKQAYLNSYFESACDLMDVLKAPLHFAGLGFKTQYVQDTRLSIEFLGEDHSSQSDYYKPAHIAAQFSTMKNLGGLAHTIGQAIDHFVGKSCGFERVYSIDYPLYTDRLDSAIHYFNKDDVLVLYPELQESFLALMHTITTRKATDEEIIKSIEFNIESCRKSLEHYLRIISRGVKTDNKEDRQKIIEARERVLNDMTIESLEYFNIVCKSVEKKSPNRDKMAYISRLIRNYNEYVESLREIKEDKVVKKRWNTNTHYYAKSKEMDKLAHSKYLQQKPGLFARAFECYVEDKLKEMGRRNDYLVHSTSNDSYDTNIPYPAGEERERINNEMENFLKIFVSTFSVYLEDITDDRSLAYNNESLDINKSINESSTPKEYVDKIDIDNTIDEKELSEDEKVIKETMEKILKQFRF